jgi:hypothetical protein
MARVRIGDKGGERLFVGHLIRLREEEKLLLPGSALRVRLPEDVDVVGGHVAAIRRRLEETTTPGAPGCTGGASTRRRVTATASGTTA